MRHEIITCNRCKREIRPDDFYQIQVVGNEHKPPWDLCPECYEILVKWICMKNIKVIEESAVEPMSEVCPVCNSRYQRDDGPMCQQCYNLAQYREIIKKHPFSPPPFSPPTFVTGKQLDGEKLHKHDDGYFPAWKAYQEKIDRMNEQEIC